MTETTTAQSATASPAAETAPSAASPQVESPPSQAQGTKAADQGAEPSRGADGKFAKRDLPQVWKDKPDRFAKEREEAAQSAAPPVPGSPTAPPQPGATQAQSAPKGPPKDANFVPQPRFDTVIAERNTWRQKAEAYERELAQARQQMQQSQYAPPAQQPAGVPDEVARFLGLDPEAVPPQLAQMFQQMPQLQQQVEQMRNEREAQQAQAQLASEADHAMRALTQQGVPQHIAQAAIRNGMGYIRDDDRLQVIDAAALWLQRHRDLLAWGEPAQLAQPPARQPMAAPPVPVSAPAGVPNAPVKPQRGAPWQEKIDYVNRIMGR